MLYRYIVLYTSTHFGLLLQTCYRLHFYILIFFCSIIGAGLAQSVERRTLNPVVEGSSPSVGASFCSFDSYRIFVT